MSDCEYNEFTFCPVKFLSHKYEEYTIEFMELNIRKGNLQKCLDCKVYTDFKALVKAKIVAQSL